MMKVKVKVVAIGLGLVLLLCTVVVAFEAMLFPSGPADRPAAGATAAGARAPVPSPTRSARAEPSRRIAEPEAQEPQSSSAPALASAPLPPEQENARLRKILDDSGLGAGDALDRTSHDIANELVARLRSQDAQVNLQAVECRAAGCSATLEVAADADYLRLHSVFDGLDPKSPLARWPGSRIMPPAVRRDGKLIVAILLIRPDSRTRF